MNKLLVVKLDCAAFLKNLKGTATVVMALLIACAALVTAPAFAQVAAQPTKVVNIRTGHTLAAEHPFTELMKRWGDSVAKKTNGAFKIEVHPGGVLGSGRTAPEGVAIGAIESYYVDPSEYASFNPALQVLSAAFVFNDRHHLVKGLRNQEIFNALYGPVVQKGIRCLALGYSGTRHLTTKSTAIRKPEDLKGLRIRVPDVPLYRDMVGAWGATPTPLPMAEVFLGLQTGTVVGQENPFAQILSNRLYEVQKYLILTAHVIQPGSIIFNEKLFQAQPKEYQNALIDAAVEAFDWHLEYQTAEEAKMLERLKGYGMAVVEPDREAFRQAMKPVYDKYDPIWTRELREKIQNLK